MEVSYEGQDGFPVRVSDMDGNRTSNKKESVAQQMGVPSEAKYDGN